VGQWREPMNITRQTIFFLLILVPLVIAAKCTASATVEKNCPPNQRCSTRVSGTVTIERFAPSSNDFYAQSFAGIFDLATQWEIDPNKSPTAKVKIINGSNVAEEEFPLIINGSRPIPPISKETNPIAFEFADTEAAHQFLSQNASLLQDENSSISVTYDLWIREVNCNIQSGKYINHLRVADNNDISYVRSITFSYHRPDNVQNDCEAGDITIIN
jgi:hypothetical protein